MMFANPAGLLALGLAIPIIALHILRSRRVEVPVASTLEWQQLDRPVAAARPWQRLRWSIPLFLQLLLVALLAVALARPSFDTGEVSADHLVVLVDTSASMGATDGSPTRLASAKRIVDDLVSELGEGAVVSVITTGAPARVVATRMQPSGVSSRLEPIEVSEGAFDSEGASSLALGMDSPDEQVAYALVSDGGLGADDLRLIPAGTEYHRVGRRDTNLGVTNVVVSSSGDRTHVQATITNAGRSKATAVVRVDVDHRSAASRSVSVPRNDSTEVGFDVPAGEHIDVFLDHDDLLSLDNHVVAVGPASRTLKVLQVGAANPFLDALVGSRPLMEVTHEEQAPAVLSGFDVAIFDQVAVPADISIPYLAIAPPGGAPGVTASGVVEAPVPALVRNDTILLDSLDLSQLAIAEAQRIAAPAATTLVGAEQTPLMVSGSEDGTSFVYLGFSFTDSNLGLLPAFPILGDRIISTLSGADMATGSLTVGDTIALEAGTDVIITSPSGTETLVSGGQAPPELDRVGLWSIRSADGGSGSEADTVRSRFIVVNPPPGETLIAVRRGLAIPGIDADTNATGAPLRRSIVPWVLVIACAVVVAEWWFSSRRRGVARRQWRFATAARVTVLLALLVSLIAPTLHRRSNNVATVFVVDVSDSTRTGRAKAVEAVSAAIAAMPPGSAAGVVAVGAEARVDAAVSEKLRWGGVDVTVDGSATNLAAGIRVAAAMASTEYARRVVLVSDGRPTTGNLQRELARLRSSDITLDVIPLDAPNVGDVLVQSVEVPDRVRPGESIKVTVRVFATEPQLATVTLRRNDQQVARRSVQLKAGDNAVEFTQPAGDPGTIRWTATVAGPTNGIVDNDTGRAATRIEGQASVLVIEGSPGESEKFTQMLRSFGTAVNVIAPEELSELAMLAQQDLNVLVNVPLSSLSDRQIDAIATATRDLGVGLLTLGGTSSYGAGDYLGSTLEDLLPVVSEVKDPKRKSKVAQVFAVDVSGSMGACHCAEGSEGDNSRLGGGVKKTDIARDAAVLALEGLSPSDELGVLALDDQFRWVRDLSAVGDGKDARRQMSGIKVTEHGTNLEPGLSESAAKLRTSDASIRHIIMFTDGFIDTAVLTRLRGEAAALRDSGITVSVMGTGEGAAKELRAIASAGGGRYYPGRDLNNLPNLLLQETKIVSRQMIEEGKFTPERSSAAPMVAALSEVPQLAGYVATTARPAATTHLVVGPERDPLLATWRIGAGNVASWTSDSGQRWAGGWLSWAGAPTFWGDVMRTLYKSPAGTLAVRFDRTSGNVTASFDDPVADGADVTATVVDPSGVSQQIRLNRVDDRAFEAAFPTGAAGSYGIGVTAMSGRRSIGSITGVAELSYSPEYGSEPPNPQLLKTASAQASGRGEIRPDQAFDTTGLTAGRRPVDLRRWLILLAALLWPIAVALSRLRFASGPDAMSLGDRDGRLDSVLGGLKVRRDTKSADDSRSKVALEGSGEQRPSVKPTGPGSGPATPTSAQSASSQPPKKPVSSQPPEKPARSGPAQQGPDQPTSPDSSIDSLLAAKRAKRRGSSTDLPDEG